jgi:hypothetical protein
MFSTEERDLKLHVMNWMKESTKDLCGGPEVGAGLGEVTALLTLDRGSCGEDVDIDGGVDDDLCNDGGAIASIVDLGDADVDDDEYTTAGAGFERASLVEVDALFLTSCMLGMMTLEVEDELMMRAK